MNGENGNGTKALWAVVLAGLTIAGNGAVWVVGRLSQIDDDRQKMAVMVEQRLGRMEAKLDRLWQLESGRGRQAQEVGRRR